VLATATGPHLFWITSRAAGTAALLLSSTSVGVGVTMGGRLWKGRGVDLRVAHEALSVATIVAIVVHGVSLLGDSYLRPSLADIAIPFASSYREPWMAIGIVAGWATLALGLSFYLRGRIGPERWKRIHRFTALAWILGIAHALGEGTDAGQRWFLVGLGAVALPALGLLLMRHLTLAPTPPRTVER